jgi:nucleotide-binding universal stress UspA family protein
MTAARGPVLVGLDGSHESRVALEWAAEEATLAGVPLVVVHAWQLPSVAFGHALLPADANDALALIHEEFTKTIAELAPPPVPVELAVRAGDAATVLSSEASIRGASLLVVGSRGRGGVAGLLLGSVSDSLAQSPHQPLVVTRGDGSNPRCRAQDSRIVVGTDGSAHSQVAVDWAADEAARHGWSLELVTGWDHPNASTRSTRNHDVSGTDLERHAQDGLEDQVATLNARSVTVAKGVFRHGRPARILLEQAANAELLIVGTRGLTGLSRLRLGSTSRAVLHHAQGPVAVIPSIDESSLVEPCDPSPV